MDRRSFLKFGAKAAIVAPIALAAAAVTMPTEVAARDLNQLVDAIEELQQEDKALRETFTLAMQSRRVPVIEPFSEKWLAR